MSAITTPLLQKIDAVTVPVPDLDAGLRFYRDSLGHELRWRNDQAGQAGLGLPGSDTEIVLTTRQAYEPDWLVASADHAAAAVRAAGGRHTGRPQAGFPRTAPTREQRGPVRVISRQERSAS